MPKLNLGKVVGDKGDPFTFDDFTPEQLDEITPKMLKGNVTTLEPDENATVDIRKEGLNNYVDFGIPRGKNGAEIKNISAENVEMADGTTVNKNIDNLNTPTFNDSTSTYATLNDANIAAETASNAIKNKVSIFTILSNMKKSFSAIVQGLKILGTNVGMIQGITSDLNSESDYIAASSKALATLNGNLSLENIARDGYKDNLLNVGLTDKNNAANRTRLVYNPVYNCPVTNAAAVLGIWQCVWFNSSHVFVRFTEFYPIAGRIWTNFYNTSAWSGWKSVTPQ